MIALPERAPKGPRVARRGILVRGIKNFIRLWHTGIFRSKDARPAELILDMLFVTRKTDVADNVMQKSNAALREAITNFLTSGWGPNRRRLGPRRAMILTAESKR